MKVGDLVMLSAAGRKSKINNEIKNEELGIIKFIRPAGPAAIAAGGSVLYAVDWMGHRRNRYSFEYYRRELRFAR